MSAEQYAYDSPPPSFAISPSEHHRWSWQSLDSSYRKFQAPDHRFSYIVRRLLDSETARRFTVGEAFLLPGRIGRQTGRGLYFTNQAYGAILHEVPHVVAYASPDKSNFFIDYCHGFELISSHIAPWGKEIPCLLSLLELLAVE